MRELVASRLASPRFQRMLFWVGAVALCAVVVTLMIEFVGGSDKTSVNPDKGFKPTLPVKEHALKNHHGVTVHYYDQLDPEIKATIRRFIATAVERKHLGRAWAVIAPSMRHGYTHYSWAHAKALPIVPFPVGNLDRINYTLQEATDHEILILADVSPKGAAAHSSVFMIGLSPVGHGARKWLVDYWMPRWTPLVPQG